MALVLYGCEDCNSFSFSAKHGENDYTENNPGKESES